MVASTSHSVNAHPVEKKRTIPSSRHSIPSEVSQNLPPLPPWEEPDEHLPPPGSIHFLRTEPAPRAPPGSSSAEGLQASGQRTDPSTHRAKTVPLEWGATNRWRPHLFRSEPLANRRGEWSTAPDRGVTGEASHRGRPGLRHPPSMSHRRIAGSLPAGCRRRSSESYRQASR